MPPRIHIGDLLSTQACGAAPAPLLFRSRHLEVEGALREHVSALVAVEVERGPLPVSIVPHDTVMLTMSLGRGRDPIEAKGDAGSNTLLTGFRRATGHFVAPGNCISLVALLTPIGVVQLLEGRRLDHHPPLRSPLAGMLDRAVVRSVECGIAMHHGLEDRLCAFAAWLEARATASRAMPRTAWRAARAAMRIRDDTLADVDALAAEQCVSRRQLERDFDRWLGASPRQIGQNARLQGVARDLLAGLPLAETAARQGFADQPHMNRVVRQLTGMTPRELASAPVSPVGAAFRAATGGGRVYL